MYKSIIKFIPLVSIIFPFGMLPSLLMSLDISISLTGSYIYIIILLLSMFVPPFVLKKRFSEKGYYFLTYPKAFKLRLNLPLHIRNIPERDTLATLPCYQDSIEGIIITLKRMHKIPLTKTESEVLDEVKVVVNNRRKAPAPPELGFWMKVQTSHTLLICMIIFLNSSFYLYLNNHNWEPKSLFLLNLLFFPFYYYANTSILSWRLKYLGYQDFPEEYYLSFINHFGHIVWYIPKHDDLKKLIKYDGIIDEIYLHDIMMSFKKYKYRKDKIF